MFREGLLAVLLGLAGLPLTGAEYDLGKTLGEENELFSASANTFVLKNRMFRWVSSKRDAARYSAFRNPVRATFLGFPVYEAIVSFEGNRPSRFYLSLYNRGDAGPMTYENFEKLVDSFNAAVTEWTGEKGEEQDGRLASGMMLKANFRVSGPWLYTVKWSASGRSKRDYKPEYLQFEVEKFNPKEDPRKRSLVRVDRYLPFRLSHVCRKTPGRNRLDRQYPDGRSGGQGLLRGRGRGTGAAILRNRKRQSAYHRPADRDDQRGNLFRSDARRVEKGRKQIRNPGAFPLLRRNRVGRGSGKDGLPLQPSRAEGEKETDLHGAARQLCAGRSNHGADGSSTLPQTPVRGRKPRNELVPEGDPLPCRRGAAHRLVRPARTGQRKTENPSALRRSHASHHRIQRAGRHHRLYRYLGRRSRIQGHAL